MTPEETENLMKRAEDCADSECAIDDVAELVDLLHTQQKELYERVQKIKETVEALEKVNKAEDRPVDEIRETVRAIFRVFQLGDKGTCQKKQQQQCPAWFGRCRSFVSCSFFFYSSSSSLFSLHVQRGKQNRKIRTDIKHAFVFSNKSFFSLTQWK